MDDRLKDRIAIITGASSGIGKATALRFANSGAKIAIADLKSSGTENEIAEKHGKDRATFIKCDVTQENDIASLVSEAAKWGGRLDIMCNFAGVAVETTYETRKRAHEMEVKDYDWVYSINERGVWLCCKYALKQMLEQEPREPNSRGDKTRGWIINAASMMGLVAVETAPAYVPSKHAVVGMTRQMALDYAQDRIHVNCLCPGYVNSPFLSKLTSNAEAMAMVEGQHPWTGLGRPEDIADAALFLAGDEASWYVQFDGNCQEYRQAEIADIFLGVSGHTLVVDGAYTCR